MCWQNKTSRIITILQVFTENCNRQYQAVKRAWIKHCFLFFIDEISIFDLGSDDIYRDELYLIYGDFRLGFRTVNPVVCTSRSGSASISCFEIRISDTE